MSLASLNAVAGIDLFRSDAIPQYLLGSEVEFNGIWYRYVSSGLGSNSVANRFYFINNAGAIASSVVTSGATYSRAICVPQGIILPSQFGWAVIRGVGFMGLAGNPTAGLSTVYTSTVAGEVTTTVGSNVRIFGLRAIASVTIEGFTTFVATNNMTVEP